MKYVKLPDPDFDACARYCISNWDALPPMDRADILVTLRDAYRKDPVEFTPETVEIVMTKLGYQGKPNLVERVVRTVRGAHQLL